MNETDNKQPTNKKKEECEKIAAFIRGDETTFKRWRKARRSKSINYIARD